MQACQPAAGLALCRLPFSPWANQTELWEGHPRLWCLCQRGNSAWQLLAFRQQPVFMEIILPNSRCSRLLLITAWMETKMTGFFCLFVCFSCENSQKWCEPVESCSQLWSSSFLGQNTFISYFKICRRNSTTFTVTVFATFFWVFLKRYHFFFDPFLTFFPPNDNYFLIII